MNWQKLKEKTEDHIVGLIFLLVTFLCGVVWQAVPAETWTRILEAIPRPVLAAVSVLLLIALSTAIAYIYSLRKRPKGIPESQNAFSDFRVIKDHGNTLRIEVWYFCAPPTREENDYISIWVTPLDKSGRALLGSLGHRGGEIKFFDHKALAKIDFIYNPPKDRAPETSTHIRLCMGEIIKGAFHCQDFRYRKVWTPKPDASAQ